MTSRFLLLSCRMKVRALTVTHIIRATGFPVTEGIRSGAHVLRKYTAIEAAQQMKLINTGKAAKGSQEARRRKNRSALSSYHEK